jgi:hypothetical protein
LQPSVLANIASVQKKKLSQTNARIQ